MTTINRTKDLQYNDHNKKDDGPTWSLYCLFFVLFIVVMVLSVLRPFYCGDGRRRTDNTMTTIKRKKDRQYNDHNKKDEGQTMQ
jgi:hypothetical protein